MPREYFVWWREVWLGYGNCVKYGICVLGRSVLMGIRGKGGGICWVLLGGYPECVIGFRNG